MPYDSIPARLFEQAKNHGRSPAYYERTGGKWAPTDWQTYGGQVRAAAKSLVALGLNAGDRTCVLGFNRPEWVVFDLATMAAHGAPAGIYTTCSPEEVQYIIDHAEARIVCLENELQWKKVESQLDRLPNLQTVVMMKPGASVSHPKVLSWDAFLAKGTGVSDAELDQRWQSIKAEELATLIYTSGTTGPPKGVMLSHENLAWTAGRIKGLIDIGPTDSVLSYLPLAHIAEQMFSVHAPCTYGYAAYYAESMAEVPNNLKEVQPTIFFAVPRIWEKFHAGISAKLADAPALRKKIAAWAMGVGREVVKLTNASKPIPGALQFQYNLANKIVFQKAKDAIGLGRARYCVSGAAPVGPEVLEFMAGFGVTILEVYGQSEDTGPTTFNRPGQTKIGSVGVPFPGVEVKLADDEEVLVKGPNVFQGYFKNPEATAETLRDGWLLSGDLGRWDDEGYLHIIGRKKEIIITSGGKNISPNNIEAEIKTHNLVGEAVVIGDRRKFISALIFLNPEVTAKFAAEKGITEADVATHPETYRALQRHIDAINEKFAKVEQVRKFKIMTRPLTVENGELTPTLKLKRKVISKNFSDEIESIYAE
jgi:long-chain acyl-CoA synthetase